MEFNSLDNDSLQALSDMRAHFESFVESRLASIPAPAQSLPDQWVELTETLEPGESATAKILKIQTVASVRSYTTSESEITIHDPEHYNFGLTGDRLKVTANPVSGLWECVGSYGLIRLAKNNSLIVSAATNATVSVWSDASTETSVDIENVRHDWIHNSTNIAATSKILIKWFVAEQAWRIIDYECQ